MSHANSSSLRWRPQGACPRDRKALMPYANDALKIGPAGVLHYFGYVCLFILGGASLRR